MSTSASVRRTRAAPSGSRFAVTSSRSSSPGPQGEDPGQRQSLLLAARQRAGCGVAAVGEADRAQRLVDPRPDLLGRHPAVLEAERHVVARASHDQGRLGVLHDESGELAR